jgi:hypothetical protein
MNVSYDVDRASDAQPQYVYKKQIHKNFRTPLSETEHSVCKLRDRPEDWDGYNAPRPNPAAIRHAYKWVESLYRDVRSKLWIKPYVSSDEEGDVSFEWWNGPKRLTVYVSSETAEYVKVEKVDSSLEMEDGSIETAKARLDLWKWLSS